MKVKVNIIRTYKIDFCFLSAIARESLLHRNKWNCKGKLPKCKRIFSVCYQNLLQRKWFAFKILSKQHCMNEMVRTAEGEVYFFTTITSTLFYYYRTVAKLRILGNPQLNFQQRYSRIQKHIWCISTPP